MIQLNLLPDVKLEYIRAKRFRRLVLVVSVLIGVASIAVLLVLLSVDGLQKKHLSDLRGDISSDTSALESTPQLSNILTVQNQLGSLTSLHAAEPAVSRLFGYLYELTPASVNVTNLTIDFTQQTATITGNADSLTSVNTFIDTLKYTNYSVGNGSTSSKAFSNVVLPTFSPPSNANGISQPAAYSINLSFNEAIFNITKNIKLTVPSLVTTRSEVAQPTDLFSASPYSAPKSTTTKDGGGQ